MHHLVCFPPLAPHTRRGPEHLRSASRLTAALLLTAWLATPAVAQDRGAPDAVMVFGGIVTDTNFMEVVYAPYTVQLKNLGVIGASYSHRFGTVSELTGNISLGQIGNDLTIEAEGGTSVRFGDESMGEVWAALYLRYDGFPWNDKLYTTLGANTGVSLLTNLSQFEQGRDSNGKSSEFLHYLGPEVTFADPKNKDLELVVRLHHRSGVFGLFDGVVSGSTFVSAGVRVRF